MSETSKNPLIKHFRRPAVFLKLPSKGRFWSDEALDLPLNGDIPVYPMTSADEITLKTPDALMNGASVTTVIESCCPNIKDAWDMPSMDVDAILIAIRIASYGAGMDITATCPHCKTKDEYKVNLTALLDNLRAADYSKPVIYQDLKIKLRPQKYFNVNKANMSTYEEQRIMQSLTATDITDDVRGAKVKESMMRIIDLNQMLLVKGTEYIELEDGQRVTDEEFIGEFYKNAESKLVNDLQLAVDEILKDSKMPNIELICDNDDCGKQFSIPLEFDYSNFFEQGS